MNGPCQSCGGPVLHSAGCSNGRLENSNAQDLTLHPGGTPDGMAHRIAEWGKERRGAMDAIAQMLTLEDLADENGEVYFCAKCRPSGMRGRDEMYAHLRDVHGIASGGVTELDCGDGWVLAREVTRE